MDQTKLAEAFARLKALKSNVPDHSEVEVKYVQEFHSVLDLLTQASGFDLKSFRVPHTEVRPTVTGGNYRTGAVDYSRENYCERSFLMMKVDGVLNLFQLASSPQKSEIGFKPPSE